ncbi:MAG TPA: FkbM family methyltransferase [Solirubrobacterales bacterium]|nr:FkbM family methyltransferase [Solirubrobacterales bacterium]
MPENPMIERVQSLLHRFGLHLGRHRYTLEGARDAMLHSEVDLVIDVGAHVGEYGSSLRAAGYRGKILSFEPIAEHFEQLQARAGGDNAWRCLNRAGGARTETATINVSANEGHSSSLLEMTPTHEQAAPGSHRARTQSIEVISVDEALAEQSAQPHDAYLKADTQGYEHEVLAGASEALPRCRAVELELSLTPIYEGQLLLGEMIELMRSKGFRPTHLEPEFVDPQSGELLCVNGLFQPAARIGAANA